MSLQSTQEMLAAHHRDGAHFAELMKESFSGRFNDDFWSAWTRLVEPALSAAPTLMDLGSGPGLLLRALNERHPKADVIGVECAPYMLEAMGELPEKVRVFAQDLHDPKFDLADGAVDAATAVVVIHEMNQPVMALRELHRVLKKGGRLLLQDWVRAPLSAYFDAQLEDPNAVFDGSKTPEQLSDLFVHFVEHNRFTTDDLVFLLQKTGFVLLERSEYRGGRFARLVAERV